MKTLSDNAQKMVLKAQRLEITEHQLYTRLVNNVRNKSNKRILSKIADMELEHYEFFKKYTKSDAKPLRLKLVFYYLLSRIIGITFGVKLMEHEEQSAQKMYAALAKEIPQLKRIMKEEEGHEKKIIGLLEEARVQYLGSVVLGLNDALVELTGALAGLTLAFQNTRLIAVAGLITGIAASLSMAASEYLSTKTETSKRNPLTASIYTGIAYCITVAILIMPFLLFPNPFVDLAMSLAFAVLIIFMFTFYSSITSGKKFIRLFGEMLLISLGVAAFTFLIGILLRKFVGIALS